MASLLYLCQRIPYPLTKGEKIRAFNFFDHLRKSYDVYLGTLIDDPLDREHAARIRGLCREAYFAGLDRRVAKLMCLRGLLTGEALSVIFFRNAGLSRWVHDVLRRVKPEAVVICSSNMAPYVLGERYRPKRMIMDFVDVDSIKWRARAEQSHGLDRWIYEREAKLVFELESQVSRVADAGIFVTEAEAAHFRQLLPETAAKTFGISNGVDVGYFTPNANYEAPYDLAKPTFVFTGTMDYWPNEDAVDWFAREILLRVRAEVPEASFYIVGSSPSARVAALAKLPGVHVTGRVPDVRPYLAYAVAAVAPLRLARGLQNKVLEAMAMARPTIVSDQALEGINALPGAEVVLAEGTEGFVAAALKAAKGELSQGIGAAARERVIAEHSWAANLAPLDAVLA